MSIERHFLSPALVAGLAAVLASLAACSAESECKSDAGCPEGYECASAGGVFASTAVCLPMSQDAGEDSDDTDDNQNAPQDCDGPRQWCDGACVDIYSDDAHCGVCGAVCSDVESCVDGSCECDAMCCDDDDCGEAGDCVDAGDTLVCDCHEDAEYNTFFERCEYVDDNGDPCDDVDCGFGSCEVVNNMASCDCDPGFVFDSSTMECVDPCDDVDCGPGDCVVPDDDWECDCDDGFEFDSTTEQCVSSDPCDDVNCGANESCIIVGGEAECQCDDGFEKEGSICVPIPECMGGVQECAVYVLHENAFSYQKTDYEDTDLADALDGPVIAGFGLEDTHRAYLLTDSSFVRINTTDFSVQVTGSLSALHSELTDVSMIQLAYTVPERHPGGDVGDGDGNDNVTFIRNPSSFHHGEALVLDYNFSSAGFDASPVLDWSNDFGWGAQTPEYEPYVPSTDVDYLAGWLDDENFPEWIDDEASPADACPDDNVSDNPIGIPYFGLLTSAETVHYQGAALTAGCSPFLDTNDEPFGYFSAPSPEDIGAAVWHNRTLYLFTAGYLD